MTSRRDFLGAAASVPLTLTTVRKLRGFATPEPTPEPLVDIEAGTARATDCRVFLDGVDVSRYITSLEVVPAPMEEITALGDTFRRFVRTGYGRVEVRGLIPYRGALFSPDDPATRVLRLETGAGERIFETAVLPNAVFVSAQAGDLVKFEATLQMAVA